MNRMSGTHAGIIADNLNARGIHARVETRDGHNVVEAIVDGGVRTIEALGAEAALIDEGMWGIPKTTQRYNDDGQVIKDGAWEDQLFGGNPESPIYNW
jgi:hypothetical protein